jgi:hypothetical protein
VFNRGFFGLSNSTVSGNTASLSGGGVYTTYGRTDITRSTVADNRAGAGGGLHTANGFMTLTDSTVSGNKSITVGGGVYTSHGTATLANSTISGNSAFHGGGIATDNVSNNRVNVTNSTVSGNVATRYGGGIKNGKGILTLTNSSISYNSAGIVGGGVFSDGRTGSLRSDVVLVRSLIAGNNADQGVEIYQTDGGVVTANSANLFGHSGLTNAQAFFGFIPGAADITATLDGTFPNALTAILNPALGNNGGLTQTHALPAGSPAIDGVPSGCSLQKTDQRGVPRPQDGNTNTVAECDIGAFEVVKPGTVTCDGLPATKVGTAAANTISGTSGVDVIQGLGGNDLIRGLAGNDVVCGGPGTDQMLGGTSDDRLFGEADKDSLNGEAGFDRCDGGSPTTDTGANCEQVSNVP